MPSSPGPYGPYAFIFWNDDLTDDGVRTQVRTLAAAGFRGITPSARIGLSREVGYLTEEYLRLVRVCVEECAATGLSVMLYDEASYPSGSANGAVVARDPRFAAQCLSRLSHEVIIAETVPEQVTDFWRPPLGRSPDAALLTAVATPLRDGHAVLTEARLLEVEAPGLIPLDLPPGAWRLHAIVAGPSGGTIRGAHADQDDGSALAPPAADLLNPAAVATFLSLTHDAYATALAGHLGTTVVAMFTDEPDLLGRGPRAGAVPYTPGLEQEVAERAGISVPELFSRLPGLWDGELDQPIRALWEEAVRARLHRVYYGAQSAWCAEHGIALTGHAAAGDDLGTTALLDWPGQDTVWRWVLPGETALAGPESTAAKVAASAARHRGAPTAVAEVLGAYGWQLTMDEAKWLLDWYLSRGVATLVLHAFFDSVRGNRAFESEPDLGVHHPWWPHLPALVRYLSRVADLLTAGPPQAPVAVLSDEAHAPDSPAAALLQHQVDVHYVTPSQLADGEVREGRVHLGDQRYAVVVDARRNDADRFDHNVAQVSLGPGWLEQVLDELRTSGAWPIRVEPAAPDLRVVRLGGAWLLVNEGEHAIRTRVHLKIPDGGRSPWQWDFPYEGVTLPATRETTADGVTFPLVLERRQSVLLTPSGDPAEVRDAVGHWPGEPTGSRTIEVDRWRGTPSRALAGHDLPHTAPLGEGTDWITRDELRRFAGTVDYQAELDLEADPGETVLDLGEVGEVATVIVNGSEVGVLGWAPYRVTVPGGLLHAGSNSITVRVSNPAAVYYQGAAARSGLLGPVRLHCP
ncbi:hypothetical protein [Ruania alba]|uniref:Glycosyl hydrolases family 2, sugar binding domain n=1 Tax=Ruania alba TaxID=648782 RepID=A0A1H5LRE2_9MICO|nr:hypothetical protein [Ruania alba]SEE79626.1 hypothetical protein SAMN04488554_2940 [Ruania alba]